MCTSFFDKILDQFFLKSVQVIVCLHIFSIFSFLAKMLSSLSRYVNIFSRNENIGKMCKRTITWTDFSCKIINRVHSLFKFVFILLPNCKSWISILKVKNQLLNPFFCFFSGPNNGVVLNKREGWIFFSPFLSENTCLWKIFNSY